MKTCRECEYIRSRKPYDCCNLIWQLTTEEMEMRVDTNDIDIRCPFILKEYQNTIKKFEEII